MTARKAQRSWCFIILFCIIPSSPQQCVTTDFKKKVSGKLNENSFKPLFSVQENSYGILFHKCLYYCEQDKRCIGFQICTVFESLFQCQICCHWRKIVGFTVTNTPDCKYFEKEFNFATNLARNKTTTLSSTLEGHISSNAVDGNTDCDEENSTAASRNTFEPHLLIQLDDTYTIERIVIHAKRLELIYDFGREPSKTFSLADNIVVNITDETMNRTHECGGKYPGPTGTRDVILFLCPPGTRGNSITVKKIKRSFLMSLCEVEAYGHM